VATIFTARFSTEICVVVFFFLTECICVFRVMLTQRKYFSRSINGLAFIMEKLGVVCEMGN